MQMQTLHTYFIILQTKAVSVSGDLNLLNWFVCDFLYVCHCNEIVAEPNAESCSFYLSWNTEILPSHTVISQKIILSKKAVSEFANKARFRWENIWIFPTLCVYIWPICHYSLSLIPLYHVILLTDGQIPLNNSRKEDHFFWQEDYFFWKEDYFFQIEDYYLKKIYWGL